MKEILDYRLEIATMRGLKVKAFKLTKDEFLDLLMTAGACLILEPYVGRALGWDGWSYKAIHLQVLDRA
jgi:hypothetical protein